MLDWLAALALGYILGSIPFGLVFAFAFGEGDVRKIGSGNIGATNVLRTGNKAAALLTFLFDALKGAAAVLVARLVWPDDETLALAAGLAAFLGHLYPVWLGFKGGKGVSTTAGLLFAIYWPVGLVAATSWLAIAFGFRISSLAALVTAAVAPVALLVFGRIEAAAFVAALAVLIWWAHRDNIRRLLAGTEPRIGAKKA